ncbi:transcriptional regulator, AraC family [Thiorhodococcus drewsii AZ1]|uniref:Transcriptional regulator, AraC family n=1 Tax=Thiorhodococcus drewsii AZ1 TaxID=765913 RepID=G2DWE8_9GAMM|nr:AraC family transcriptional regulator [Thiorhodococcus drewsii]EGV33648.1 transcriptional regulator, AraC family [Thiorhodococcus drewsii AZ1]
MVRIRDQFSEVDVRRSGGIVRAGGEVELLRSADFFENPARVDVFCASALRVRTHQVQPGLAVSVASSAACWELYAVADENEQARVHFNCQLRGRTQVRHGGQRFELDQTNVLASFAPGGRFHLECSADWCNVELRIAPALLEDLAGEEYEGFCSDRACESCLLRNPVSMRIQDAAVRLGHLLAEESPSSLLVQAASLEFLAWHLKSIRPKACDSGVCARERRRLIEARDILLSDLSRPPTIEQLARETGLNQLKIKRGFKAMFGTSVYALFQRERMMVARRLLQRHSVTETASRLGYSNVSHFSTAFRKQFGLLPREARRS